MKKVILFFIATFIGGSLMAQLPNFGLRLGMTTSKLSTNLSSNFESENRLGYQGGVFVRMNFSRLYVQPELIYNHRSTKLEYEIIPVADLEEQSVGVRSQMKIGTFDIPVLVGFKLFDSKLMNVRIFAGPNISFSTNKNFTYEYITNDGETIEGEVPEDQRLAVDDFNTTTWYLQAGAGVDVLFLTFDVRYEKGLSKIFEGNVSNLQDINLTNNVWVFTLGFKFM